MMGVTGVTRVMGVTGETRVKGASKIGEGGGEEGEGGGKEKCLNGGFKGVFVLKSGLRILIQAPEVQFLVPPK